MRLNDLLFRNGQRRFGDGSPSLAGWAGTLSLLALLLHQADVPVADASEPAGAVPAVRTQSSGQANRPGTLEKPAAHDPAGLLRHRQAAEWVLAREGKVRLFDKSPEGKLVESLDTLPATPILVREIILTRVSSFSDAELERLQGLNDLYALGLERTGVTDAGAKAIARLTGLRRLNLGFTELSDQGLAPLAELPHLESLNVMFTRVSDEGLRHLTPCRNLTNLRINGTAVTDAGLERLAVLTQLRELDLRDTRVSDQGLNTVAAMRTLKWLWLGPSVTDVGVQHVAGLKLEHLNLEQTGVTDTGLAALQKMATLRWVIVGRAPGLTAKGVAALKQALPACRIDQPAN